MSAKRKAIIHIGAPKTGTTSIQTFLYENRQYFAENYDLFYPDHEQLVRPESGYGHHYIAFHVFRDFFEKITPSHINLDNTFNIFRDVLKNSQYTYLLISCEGLLTLPFSSKFKEFTNIVREFYDELHIIIYVRRQDEAILAAYNTNVLMGFSVEVNEFTKDKLISFDFYNLVKSYERVGFICNVRPYERKWFKNGDLLIDFLDLLSKIIGKEIKMPESYRKDKYYLNVTQPYFIVKMIANLNNSAKDNLKIRRTIQTLRKLGKILITKIPELGKQRWNMVPPSKRREILNYFEESNRRLTQEYLKMDNLWYDLDIPETDEEWIKENAFPNSALYHLCNAIIKIVEEKRN
ncbi:MAG: hypothetical protein QXS29_10480 [Nitrososphaeria archaeon]